MRSGTRIVVLAGEHSDKGVQPFDPYNPASTRNGRGAVGDGWFEPTESIRVKPRQ
jgi:hypothetical protein